MARIVVSEFVSLEGFMEDPNGAESYRHGGWIFQFDTGQEGDKFKMDEVLDAEALLLGRLTYEGFAAAWPQREGPFADKFNSMPKYVVPLQPVQPQRSRRSPSGSPSSSGPRRGQQRSRVLQAFPADQTLHPPPGGAVQSGTSAVSRGCRSSGPGP